MNISKSQTLDWLKSTEREEIEKLYNLADMVRRDNVGDAVHLRGLVEFSNYCARSCSYCGIGAGFCGVTRYRMTHDEIMVCADKIVDLGYGTIVLQSGEDWGMDTAWLSELLRRIKNETDLAVTLSVGERTISELQEWHKCGADRYLLRFETSNLELYKNIHPDVAERKSDRFALLRAMRDIGYEVGSGVMIGIPGQRYEDIANDIMMFRELDLDMIGIGPYIESPGTALDEDISLERVVPNTVEMACKAVALARIACPNTNIPSTTALATLNGVDGRIQGLNCGANVLMPNLTPIQYRKLYSIYPAKTALNEEEGNFKLADWLLSIGRTQGVGRGDSANKLSR